MPDYYIVLEVPMTATQAEIKHAYRRLARQYHPDLNAQALDKHIKLLNEAYKVLGNSTKRASYDAQRLEEQQRKAAQERLRRQQQRQKQIKLESEMTWVQGIFGFVKELKKAIREK
ncbi:MAG: hypothetical protein NVSMB33_13830 [Ktedonobacteraceae bacterium]